MMDFTSGSPYFLNNQMLRLRDHQWSTVPILGRRPTPRYGMSQCICGANVYIYGGRTKEGTSHELFSFNMTSLTITCREVEILGAPPGLLYSSLLVVTASKLLLCGGWGDDSKCRNECYAIDGVDVDEQKATSKVVLRLPSLREGKGRGGIEGHTSVVWGKERKAFLVGGETTYIGSWFPSDFIVEFDLSHMMP
jgi:hypothetical protein